MLFTANDFAYLWNLRGISPIPPKQNKKHLSTKYEPSKRQAAHAPG